MLVCTDDGDDGQGEPAAESTVDDDPRSRSRHRRVLRLDGRSSSETSGTSTGDTAGINPGRSPAVQRGSSVDEATRSAGHNRHVSFIFSSGDVCGADSTTSSVGQQSFDGAIFPSNSRFISVFFLLFLFRFRFQFYSLLFFLFFVCYTSSFVYNAAFYIRLCLIAIQKLDIRKAV